MFKNFLITTFILSILSPSVFPDKVYFSLIKEFTAGLSCGDYTNRIEGISVTGQQGSAVKTSSHSNNDGSSSEPATINKAKPDYRELRDERSDLRKSLKRNNK